LAEARILAAVQNQAGLFERAMAAVVPKQPLESIENGIRLVARVAIPHVQPGADNRIIPMALPVVDAVPRARQADLGVIDIAKAYIKTCKTNNRDPRPGIPSPGHDRKCFLGRV
jgi:hypothetical protein